MPRSIGIVGYGAFGTFVHELIKRFAPEVVVKIHSSRHEADGEQFFALEDVSKCDVLVLSVPIAAFEEVLAKVLPHLGDTTVIVDVATVKIHTEGVLKRLAGDKRYIATHPMFGPESYEKKQGNVAGFRIVVTDFTVAPEEYERVSVFLRSLGFDIVRMSADMHDKHLAETLFLTHFIGQIVSKGEFNRTEIDTVSFGYLMDAVESVKHDTQLFHDVFKFNPHCVEVLNKFELCEADVRKLLEKK